MKKFLILATLSTILISGCGQAKPDNQLTLVFDNGSGQKITKTVQCPGDISCDFLYQVPASAWRPVKKDAICTRIWGGPETVRVKGSINGEAINADFSLSGGCEIDRWKKADRLFREVFGSDYTKRPDYARL